MKKIMYSRETSAMQTNTASFTKETAQACFEERV